MIIQDFNLKNNDISEILKEVMRTVEGAQKMLIGN